MPVQFPGTGRLGAGLGVVVHDGDNPHVVLRYQGPRVMRVPPGVEEDQVPGMRADDRAVLLNRGDVRRVRVVRENKLAAAGVIRAEEHAR